MLSRRALIFGGVQAAAGVALLSRLYYLQFIRGEEFVTEAEGNRIKVQLMIPPRGLITDRYRVPLAMNQVNYRLMLETENAKQALATLESLRKLLPLSKEATEEIRVEIRRAKAGFPVLVREHLSWPDMAKIEYHIPELPVAFIDEGQWRNYPFSDHLSHLIGYVGKVAEEEVKDNQPLLKQPDFRIGKNGIEALYEERLRGVAGTRQIEVNVLGSPVRELEKREPKPGDELMLTIDSRLQEFVVERLGEESGAVVVMNIHSGDVLALASVPAFDPNEFSKGITTNYWKALNANKKNPLLNKAIAGQYPPGSTFKMMTALAGLKSGKVTARTHVYCPGYFYLGDHRFGCWKQEGHGTVNVEQAIAQSCDTFFYTVARDVGVEAIAEVAREFKLGEHSGLGLRGEKSGIIPTPSWKQKARGAAWNPGETINTGIGQGDVLTTPLQLAIMTARLANGGKKILPRLLAAEKEKSEGYIDIDPGFFEIIQRGMDAVVNEPHGTALGSKIQEEAYRFAGKTGTSQVRKLLVVGQDQSKLPWEFRHHAWFVGYAPSTKPTICCSVIIEHGGGGAAAAAPVARDVLRKALELMEGPAPHALVVPTEGGA
jgi:penicillin-binding protein 2